MNSRVAIIKRRQEFAMSLCVSVCVYVNKISQTPMTESISILARAKMIRLGEKSPPGKGERRGANIWPNYT